MIIRKAEQKDKPAFVEIEKEFCRLYRARGFNEHLDPIPCNEVPESFFEEAFNKLLSGDFFFYVAEESGEVLGCIEAEIVEVYEKELYKITKAGHINSVFVLEKYRGRGIGTNLINKAINWMKSKDIQVCTLGVVYGNNEAIKVYEKMGFNIERVKMWKKI